MKRVIPMFALLLLALGTSAYAGAEIPLVGIDDDGNSVDVTLPAATYRKNLTATFTSVEESTMAALVHRSAGAAWRLRTVVVGIGMNVEVGLGPIIKASATPRFRILFSNLIDAPIP